MTTEPVPVLDDMSVIQSLDKRDVLRMINELPEQYETAIGIARNLAVDPLTERPNLVYVAASGDAAIAAEMAAAVLRGETDVPILTSHGDRLPNCISEESLVFVLDYFGKSELAVRDVRSATSRGARVICITSGKAVSEAASECSATIIKILPGQPQRTAMGYMFAPLIVAMEKLGLVSGPMEKLSHAVKLMKNVREAFRFENATERNLAKKTAQAIHGKMVAIYGAPDYRRPLVTRWKSQLNATSKVLALANTYPDVTESEISGWELAETLCSDLGVIVLTDKGDRGELAQLMAAAKELLDRFGVIEIEMRGATSMEKMLYGAYLGDYTSYYLAILNGVDPMRTDNISYVQTRLAGEETPSAEEVQEQAEES